MAHPESVRRLIVNADDFGRSDAINQAVVRAHREGILTSASLMVNEPGSEDAVVLARQNPGLAVGLHLTLVCGHAASPPGRIPNLVDSNSAFSDKPVLAGLRYFVQPAVRSQLEREIAAQFEKFHAHGLKLDHVNGHLHFHMHPTVFGILMRRAREWGISHFRLTRDRLRLNFKIASGHFVYRLSHALIFMTLAPWARSGLNRRCIRHSSTVFGLMQNARVDEDYVSCLIPRLPPGDSELYSHPSLDEFRNEFDALVSPKIRELVRRYDVKLIRYADL